MSGQNTARWSAAVMWARTFFALSVLLIVSGASLLVGLYSGYERNRLLSSVLDVYFDFREVFDSLQTESGFPLHHVQPSRRLDGNGTVANEIGDDGSLILISSYYDDSNEIRLIRRDGSVVARWPVSYQKLFPDTSYLVKPPLGDANVDIHGALIEPDGSIVFNFEYSGSARLSRCGETLWTLPYSTHHSVEPSEKGGYWIPGRIEYERVDPSLYVPFTQVVNYGIKEDVILHVSETGEIIEQKPVFELLYANGMAPTLTATGYSFSARLDKLDGKGTWADEELVHMNQIRELSSELADQFPLFEAGDLAISLRQYNLIVVVDPDDWKVKWYQVGPWIRQHSPVFVDGGLIALFNNNTHPSQFSEEAHRDPTLIEGSNIMAVDPVTREVKTLYGDRPGEEMLSFIRGKLQALENGNIMIAEFEAGRALEITPSRNVVWEYVNRLDDDYVFEVSEARVYPASYFTVTDWSCP